MCTRTAGCSEGCVAARASGRWEGSWGTVRGDTGTTSRAEVVTGEEGGEEMKVRKRDVSVGVGRGQPQ